MFKFLGKLLNVYEDEINLFFWSAVLLFLIRTSNILFNNFAETAFLKRFGVEYLPIVYVANSITTFVIMGFLTGIMAKLPGSRLLSRMLIFCGVTVAGLRFVIPLGIEFLYPVLFVLKSQYEVLLGLVFWNMANDLFNTRQSKRLFPLITAGGVMGGIIGSFGTPFLARTISLDNLMLVYLVTTTLGAMAVKHMGTLFPTLLLSDKKGKKGKSRGSLITEFKKVLPLIKESGLVKILILLTLLPNIIIPIINYQFNFAIDETFATEGGMIKFFGYFRGILNVISLIILLFVGRVYGRWGLPIVLMFHPFNYVIAFLAFLLRFDIFSAMYARISTNVLRTTMNNPARAVLMGLFPLSYRAVIRPFLRGTVVRIGILTGSGIIMLSEGWLHPRFLSIAAAVFAGGWVVTTFFLKRNYSKILLDLISKNMLDLKSLEEADVSHIFLDKKIQSQLVEAFLSTKGNTCLWYANLIKSLGIEGLDAHILSIIKDQDDRTKIGLLGLLSPEAGEEAIGVFEELADPVKPNLTVATVRAANRLPVKLSSAFNLKVFKATKFPEVKAYAISGLYRQTPKKCKKVIDSWMASDSVPTRTAGIVAAGESGDGSFISRLKEMLAQESEDSIIPFIIKGLRNLGAEETKTLALAHLNHPLVSVRLSVLEAIEIESDEDLRTVIGLMGDSSDQVHGLAKDKLEAAPYHNAQLLVESLTIPRRKVREGIFDLLESLNISDVDIFRFAQSQLERAYGNLAEAEALRRFQDGRERDILIDHLIQKRDLRLETILRVLATQDRSGKMRVIWRGIFSADSRQKSNALEALEDSVGRSLSMGMMPLLEDLPISHCLDRGKKMFQLPAFDSDPRALYPHLLSKHDWVTVVLGLNLIEREGFDGLDKGIAKDLVQSKNIFIRQMSQRILGTQSDFQTKETEMEEGISIPDKIFHLKGIHIFEGLTVSEMAAIASVTEEEVYPKGNIVIKEGEQGETMYMIISGEVSVIKGQEGGNEIELARIRDGDYFGEMALFEDMVRSATVRTEEETRLLVLHKREFTEIVREYPEIALCICKVLSHRLRTLHEMVQNKEKNDG